MIFANSYALCLPVASTPQEGIIKLMFNITNIVDICYLVTKF